MKRIAIFAVLAGAALGQVVFPPPATGASAAAGATGDMQCKASNGTLTACGANDSGTTISLPARALSVSGTAPPAGAPAGILSAPIIYSTAGILNVKAYGAKGDTTVVHSCVISASSTSLHCDSSFSSSAVGMSIIVNGAGVSSAALRTTIASVAGGNATLSVAAGTATTGLWWQGAAYGTDDATAVQAAITALVPGQTLEIPTGIYFISSALSLNLKQSVAVTGHGNARQSTDWGVPQLLYTGSTGSLLTLGSVIGIKIQGLYLGYFDPGYNGKLIDIEQTSQGNSVEVSITDCSIGGHSVATKNTDGVTSHGTQAGQAAALIYMNLVYDINIERNVFHVGQVAIQGPTASYINANAVRIRDNFFSGGFFKAPIQIAGQMWQIQGNTFEPMDTGYSTAGTCGAIQAVEYADGNISIDTALVSGNTMEDAVNGTGICMDFNGHGVAYNVNIAANQFAYGGIGIRTAAGKGWTIKGNHFDHFTTAIDTTSGVWPSILLNSVSESDLSGNTYTFVTTMLLSGHLSISGSAWDAVDLNGIRTTSSGGLNRIWGPLYLLNNGNYTQAGNACASSGRQGTTFWDNGTWSGTSDEFVTCVLAGGRYQYINFPQGKYAVATVTGRTSSITATNLQFSSAALPAGLYQATYYLRSTTAGAGATVDLTFGWTDDAGAQTQNVGTLDASAVTNHLSGNAIIKTNGSTNLTYATVLTNTATYALDVSVTRIK